MLVANLVLVSLVKCKSFSSSNSSSSSSTSYGSSGCKLPTDPNIVPITPSSANQGWAMSPDQSCTPGSWCPYACKPGMYSAQWDQSPESNICTNGPACGSMNGGLYCSASGELEIPKPDSPLCLDGIGRITVENRLTGEGSKISLCQTVYPGNEAMLIPTVVVSSSSSPLNVLPNSYWMGTSAQYYVNPPGTDFTSCIWGNSSEDVGNWAPYVLGAGQGSDGNVYMSLSVNPNFSGTLMYSISINCQSASQAECLLGPSNRTPCTVTVINGQSAVVLLSDSSGGNGTRSGNK